jgi:hypothetical protein
MPRRQKRATARARASDARTPLATPRRGAGAIGCDPANPAHLKMEDLDDRQRRGFIFREMLAKDASLRKIVAPDEEFMYKSLDNEGREEVWYRLTRTLRNDRGTLGISYQCFCPDQKKAGRRDCAHRFCQKLIDGGVVVSGTLTETERNRATAERRPARNRTAHSGKNVRSTQRDARVRMPTEIPRLILSLKAAWEGDNPKNAMTMRHNRLTADGVRCAALLLKVCEGKSADAMIARYQDLIDDGHIALNAPPHQNTLTNWMNDIALTAILLNWLFRTTSPFRKREVAAIADSTKISQLRVAHSRLVEYGSDKRPTATWVKAHVLIGLETMIVMAIEFSTKDRGDIDFLKPLVEKAREVFNLKFFLADKAYLSEDVLGWLWDLGIRACIPVKSKWDLATKTIYYEAARALVEWYDGRPRSFDEFYRLRPKIEGAFSLLKRLATGFCWSRGRGRRDKATGKLRFDQSVTKHGPCVAWQNETICKFIYTNLRATVTLEEETGVEIDYTTSRFFPPPDEPLIRDFI